MSEKRSAKELTTKEVGAIYERFASDVAETETEIEVPIGEPAGMGETLREPATELASEHRSVRTVPAINVYQQVTDRSIPESVVAALTGLDTVVNAADDLIDIESLSDGQRLKVCSTILFGHALLVDELGSSSAASGILRDYYTALAQIPAVERRLQHQLSQATDRDEKLTIARRVYKYDSVDIEAFARLPGIELDLDPTHIASIVADLRTFRARYLLFEDLRHVDRALEQGDTDPVLYFLQTCESAADATQCIAEIASTFTYPDTETGYQDLLRSLERYPESLESMVEEKMAMLHPSSKR